MAIDKAVDSAQLDAAMTATANAIRTQGGTSAQIEWKQTTGFAEAIGALSNITLTSIEIVTPPSKTQYAVGESPDTTGAVLKATYSNGATRTLTSGWTASFDYGNTSGAMLSDSAVTFKLTEGGHTATCDSPIEVLNPITISATVETGRAVVDTRTLRAVTYYDGRYIMIETTDAEQVYTFHFLKDSPTSLGASYMSASRPYPVSCVAADGNYVWLGLTTGRGTTPYSNRYLLRVPYADFIADSYSLNYWGTEGYSIEAVSGLDATNGYFTACGSKNNITGIRCHIDPSDGSITIRTASAYPVTDICVAGTGVAWISKSSEAEGVVGYNYDINSGIGSTSPLDAPAVKIAAKGSIVALLTEGDSSGNPWYSAGFATVGGISIGAMQAIGNVADADAEIIGMEAVGDYYVAASKASDRTMLLTVMQSRGAVVGFRNFQTDITDPVALCKTDDGVTVVGQANGKYTITQLTVA